MSRGGVMATLRTHDPRTPVRIRSAQMTNKRGDQVLGLICVSAIFFLVVIWIVGYNHFNKPAIETPVVQEESPTFETVSEDATPPCHDGYDAEKFPCK